MKYNYIGIIPARFASSRFPGKPLALVDGTPMIIKVWQRAIEALDQVYIATDHNEIKDIAEKAGAVVILTSSNHNSGTERIAEAAEIILAKHDKSDPVILNIQGDEPLINTRAIKDLCKAFQDEKVGIATLMHKISDPDSINNPNRPKVVTDARNNALYFSRAPIPWTNKQNPHESLDYFQHIGVYAFRYSTLRDITNLPPTPLELSESLEQLRWLENGYSIRCIETNYEGIGVDTPEDLEKLNSYLKKNQPSSAEK